MELVGLREVLQNLKQLPPGMQDHCYMAFDAGMIKVKAHMRDNHPEWESKKLGPYFYNPDGTWRYHNISTNLTNSIHYRIRRMDNAIEGDVGILTESVKEDAMEYAPYIEREHPFIAPAVEAKRGEWEQLIANAIIKFLK